MPANSAMEVELDPRRLEQRQKQIDYGLATVGYANYMSYTTRFGSDNIKLICTPNIYWKCSKRTWDSLVREWRRELHAWDTVFCDKMAFEGGTMRLPGAPGRSNVNYGAPSNVNVTLPAPPRELPVYNSRPIYHSSVPFGNLHTLPGCRDIVSPPEHHLLANYGALSPTQDYNRQLFVVNS